MKKNFTLLVALLVLGIFTMYMVTFQVRYDEVAVLTTFGKAQEPTRDANNQIVDAGSLKLDAGLKFKAPWPFQKVYTYSKKLNLLEGRLEELQTADGNSVIVKAFVGWKIEDPYAFFRTLSTMDRAEDQLRSEFRYLEGIVSKYRFDELVHLDADHVKLEEIENEMASQLRERLAQIKPGYGISIEKVGFQRLMLPEQVTEKVFERMKKTRERLAESARAEGTAQAAAIEAEAESAKKRILAFANRRADAIRSQGDREAASHYSAFAEDAEFAIFLRQIQAMKKMLPHNATFVIDSEDLDTLKVLKLGPDAE